LLFVESEITEGVCDPPRLVEEEDTGDALLVDFNEPLEDVFTLLVDFLTAPWGSRSFFEDSFSGLFRFAGFNAQKSWN